MTNAQSPPPPGAFGKYWLERRIGVGGTAEVYLARAGGPEGPALVIKRPLPELRGDPGVVEPFLREARLLQQIQHPGVVRVHEAGTIQGEPYLAMQHIDGVDAFRLLRRAHAEGRRPPEALGVHVGMRLCEALHAVHRAADAQGQWLGLVHRDVTPSNVYLSLAGEVILGDFGIAHPLNRASRPTLQSSALKGKHGYLAPELILGEPADARADQFSCAVVVAELLLGKPLFAGAGQVAVLLAIRDGRIDALRTAARHLSPGLFAALERALSRDPALRFPDTRALGQALAPFAAAPADALALVREWVAWSRDARGLARRLGGALLESQARLAGPASMPPSTVRQEQTDELIPASEPWSEEPTTARMDEVPSRARFSDGRYLPSVSFARLIEMVVTGELGPADEVDLMGQGFRRVAAIELLERHLPAASTRNLERPAPPDEQIPLEQARILHLLGRLTRDRETGLLLIEGSDGPGEPARREVYLHRGALLHVAAPEASDLLGQALIRQGLLSPSDLDLALAVLHRFHGRLGDTLIALGLADPVTLFRAIESQGRERFLRVFSWTTGQASFFRKVKPSHVEFPLDIPLTPLLLEGASIAFPNDAPVVHFRATLGRILRATPGTRADLQPAPLEALLQAVGARGMELRRALAFLASSGTLAPADALRAVLVGLALGLCELA
ncbi:MAG: serine/threonine protein kinase [Polyangiaceae bacterium]|jgi:serine/threonine-protein kinase|nr:serine/threonine protein kinase [Polyangiaceae bacterium]